MSWEAVAIEGGIEVCVPARLDRLTSYVLREQRGWFEAELPFLRRLLEPGMTVVDVGASYGLYTLTAARQVGPSGRVWSFEPQASVAALLRQSLTRNEFLWVQLQQEALSDREGEATLHAPDDTELGSLAAGAAGSGQTVRVRTLDAAAEALGIDRVDLLKLDAEGEETRIVEAGAGLLRRADPLLLFERKHGQQVNEPLLDRLQSLGFGLYRLLPGLGLLVPFDRAAEVDDFQLNLFACSGPRAAALEARGLLARAVVDEPSLPALERRFFWQKLDTQPYARKLAPTWTSASPDRPALDQALARHAAAHLYEGLPPSTRAGLLMASFGALSSLAASAPTLPRLLSLGRVAWEAGERAYAVAVLSDVVAALKAGKAAPLDEPFLSPSPRFERLSLRGPAEGFCLASSLEQRERLRTFSTFFTGPAGLDDLRLFQKLGYPGEEIERRVQLITAVFLGSRAPG